MSLWVHKYRPQGLAELSFNPQLTQNLEQLCKEEDFPHLLIYGPPGSGKQTRVGCVLKELFGPGSRRIKIESRTLDLGGSRKLELSLVSSIYHVEITPSEAGNQDRFVIQELLKEIAQTQQVDQSAKHKYKIVVINEADTLSRDAQAALRRTMEIYTSNLRIIMVATSLSPIMGPIKSRCLLVRSPAPTNAEITGVLEHVSERESVGLIDEDVLPKIASASNRNLRKALLILESMYARNETLSLDSEIPIADWEAVLQKEADQIVQTQTTQKLAELRTTNYELMAHCIPPQMILKTLLLKLLPKVSAQVAPEIIEAAALFDHRIKLGSKAIFHIEAFIAKVMHILATKKI